MSKRFMNLRNASVRGMVWIGIEGGSTLLISAVSLFVMGRLVGPTDFGLAALAIAIVQFVGLLSEHLLQDAMIQRHDLTLEHESTAHCASFLLGVAGLVVCLAAAVPLAHLFGAPEFTLIMVAVSLPLPLTGLIAVPTARLRRAFQFRPLVTRTIISRLSGVIVGPTFAILGYGAWSLVLQHLSGVLFSVVMIMQASPPNVPMSFRWPRFRELLAVGAPIIGTGLAHMLQDRLFLALVGTVLDVRAAGFVNMTFRLAGTLKDTTMSAVNGLSLSTFARQQDDAAGLRRSFEENRRFIALLAHPIFFGLFATADQIVPLVLGGAWLPVVPLMQGMALAASFQLAVYQSEAVVSAIGRPGFATTFFTLAAAAVAVLIPLLRPQSPFVALMIWIGVMVAAAPPWIVGVARITGWSAATLLVPGTRGVLCAAAMAAGLLVIDALLLQGSGDSVRLFVKIGGGIALYGALTVIFNRDAMMHFVTTLRDRGPKEPTAASSAATAPAREA
jgi:PST family polysaccharide transporter